MVSNVGLPKVGGKDVVSENDEILKQAELKNLKYKNITDYARTVHDNYKIIRNLNKETLGREPYRQSFYLYFTKLASRSPNFKDRTYYISQDGTIYAQDGTCVFLGVRPVIVM